MLFRSRLLANLRAAGFGTATQARAATLQYTGIVTSVLLVGWAVGGILFGKVCDRIGRTKTLMVTMAMYAIGTNGGANGLQKKAPSRELADQWLDQALRAPFKADANDTLYQWNASRDFAPEGRLEQIKSTVLMINSADDERNPPELLQAQKALPRIKNLSVLIIPGSEETSGHGTTGQARWWADKAKNVLENAPILSAR